MLITYVLAIVIMFLIPERWMPKGNTPDEIVTEKGLYRKTFIIGGALVIVIATLIACFGA
jgi:hypothetical protein